MTKTIILTNRRGEDVSFEVEDADQIIGAFRFFFAGDECMILGFPDDLSLLLDSGEEGRDFTDVEYLTPADIPWEGTVHDA